MFVLPKFYFFLVSLGRSQFFRFATPSALSGGGLRSHRPNMGQFGGLRSFKEALAEGADAADG